MEQSPSGVNFSPEKFSDGKEKKKKGKSKRFGFVAPVIESSEPKVENSPKEQSETDKLLAGLAFSREKQEKHKIADEAAAAEKKQAAKSVASDAEKISEISVEPVSEEQARQKLLETFNTDYQQEIKATDLPPSKLFSEGVIDLGHEDEQIVALREEQKAATENEPILWRSQPEQQHQAQQEESGEQELTERDVPHEEARPAEGMPEATPTYYEPSPSSSRHETEPPAPVPAAQQASAGAAPSFNAPNQAPSSATAAQNPNTLPLAPSPANTATPMAANLPPNPNMFGMPIPHAANYNQMPAAPTKNVVDKDKYVTVEEYDEGVYQATKQGQRKGVLAGLTVAGYEHFKHRRRERKLKKELQVQGKAAANTEKQQYFEAAEQKKLLNEKERQLKEMQAAAARQPRPESQPVAPHHERTTVAEAARFTGSEKKAENHFKTQLEKLVPKRLEKSKSGEIEPAEKLEVPEGHHLETSAWHTIEVDTKTGKAVETPTFAYGEEYYRERAKETRPRTSGQQQAAGEVAIVAAAMADKSGTSAGGRPARTEPADANTQQRTNTRQILTTKAKSAFQAGKAAMGNQQNSGPLWPWLLAFAVVVVLLIVVL
ncbi:hypothetical protein EYC59_00770 [Candidatus Saccharibacteria bacterium]|nr:MAG: hypothetical protein EYC59_00770 [Candidatus Saccharibacteria bacterium]